MNPCLSFSCVDVVYKQCCDTSREISCNSISCNKIKNKIKYKSHKGLSTLVVPFPFRTLLDQQWHPTKTAILWINFISTELLFTFVCVFLLNFHLYISFGVNVEWIQRWDVQVMWLSDWLTDWLAGWLLLFKWNALFDVVSSLESIYQLCYCTEVNRKFWCVLQ